jgi:hypothetical protein
LFDRSTDLDALLARLQRDGLSVCSPIGERPWGHREFTVIDPDGYRVTIARPIEPTRSASETDERVLGDIQQQLASAWVSGDRATLERLIAPEWRSTGPDGSASTRASVFADVFDTKVHRINRVDIDQITVRVFGDAAVVTGRTHGAGAYAGAAYDVVIRFTDTFIRRDGQWSAVASHASLVA